MAELLEIDNYNSFSCIFHPDNNPSAGIFQNKKGVWLYNCFSCGRTMNIKQLIETIGNFKSEYRAIKFIKDIYNLSIAESGWALEQKANLDSIIRKLNMGVFAQLCPQANTNIRYTKNLFAVMLHIAKDNVYIKNYTNSKGDIVFFTSLDRLARTMKVSYNRLNVISQRIAILAYHNLIRKLDDAEIPEVMLDKAKTLAKKKGYSKRINFYCIPSWVFEQMQIIEKQGFNWKKYGYTAKATSYEMFYRAEGLQVAQKIYPQHKKVIGKTINYDTGEVTESIKDRTTSITSDRRVKRILDSIRDLIKKKGYATEREIIANSKVRENQFKKFRGQLKQFNYKRIRTNKKIKEAYGITCKGYPFIIIGDIK